MMRRQSIEKLRTTKYTQMSQPKTSLNQSNVTARNAIWTALCESEEDSSTKVVEPSLDVIELDMLFRKT